MQVYVYGDYGYENETLLFSADWSGAVKESCDWATRYCRGGDLGGYSSIDVLTFNDDGEARTHWRRTRDDD